MEAKNLAEMYHTPQLDWSRHRAGPDRRVQRALGRAAALACVPDHAAFGYGAADGGAGRRDAVAFLAVAFPAVAFPAVAFPAVARSSRTGGAVPGQPAW